MADTVFLQPGRVDRDFDTFIRWFEYRFNSVIIDLSDDPVIHDEL